MQLDFQCFQSINDVFAAANIVPDNTNGNLSHDDIQRLLPALAYAKFNSKCDEPQSQGSWKSTV